MSWQCNACRAVYPTEAEAARCPCEGHSHARTRLPMPGDNILPFAYPPGYLARPSERPEPIVQTELGRSLRATEPLPLATLAVPNPNARALCQAALTRTRKDGA